jgi:sterol desaturase/sphingolipid hydroxylase (fatty acid hydroxylase superfamily)
METDPAPPLMPPPANRVGHVRPTLSRLVSIAFYPAALCLTLLYIFLEVRRTFGPLGSAYPVYLALLIFAMVLLERLVPLRAEWAMSWRSLLRRDIPMLVMNGIAIAITARAVTALSEWLGGGRFLATHLGPWWVQAALVILLSDFVWYWVHRYSHEASGPLGGWLWRTHVMHHLPAQVYVFMHVVAHPLNAAGVRVILMLPAVVFGFSKEAIFAAAVLNGLQGLVSHFNVDVRAGWLNYLFMGTELHRYHHSADAQEGKNYAAVVTLWDQIFGTFSYHPGGQPDALGVHDRAGYPSDHDWLALMRLPFRRGEGGQ